MRTLAITALLVAVATSVSAQRVSPKSAHVATAKPRTAPSNPAIQKALGPNLASLLNSHRSHSRQSFPSALGLFPDLFYPDNPPPESSPPPMQSDLLMQALSGLTALSGQAGTQPEGKSDSQSLLIELQGDRYVNLTSAKADASEPITIPRSQKPAERAAVAQLSPVTLLFRDGHREDIRDYTIADGVIYARGDLYRDGYWSKKIEVSALDLPETVKSNEVRGIRFVLPKAPNEVITRP
jgi:hypothetical protein